MTSFLSKVLVRLHALARLSDVEPWFTTGRGWMLCSVSSSFFDLERLADLQGHDVRLVHAARLVELDGLRRRRIGAGDATPDVDEDVLQAAVLHVHDLALEAVLCSFWQYGSAETLIFSGPAPCRAKLILPPSWPARR